MTDVLDLFGNPIREARGRPGRPSHVPDQKSTNTVKLLILCDRTEDEIADALRITAKTLRKHYSRLFKERDRVRAEAEAGMLSRMVELGMGGNASMMKLAIDKIARAQEERWSPRQTVDDKTGEKLGKKQQADKEAKEQSLEDWLGADAGPGQAN